MIQYKGKQQEEIDRAFIHTQSCPNLCDPLDYNLPGSSVHGILQASILQWVAMPSSRGSSLRRDRTHFLCIGRRILYPLSRCEMLCMQVMKTTPGGSVHMAGLA